MTPRFFESYKLDVKKNIMNWRKTLLKLSGDKLKVCSDHALQVRNLLYESLILLDYVFCGRLLCRISVIALSYKLSNLAAFFLF